MNINITPNTTPISADVLTPVAKTFASGGGDGGGGGGAVNLNLNGNVRAFYGGASALTIGPGASAVALNTSVNYFGGRNLLAIFNAEDFFVGPPSVMGLNLVGTGLVTLAFGGGLFTTATLKNFMTTLGSTGYPQPVGLPPFLFQRLVTPSVAGAYTASITIQNNFSWDNSLGPSEPVALTFGIMSLTIMEI